MPPTTCCKPRRTAQIVFMPLPSDDPVRRQPDITLAREVLQMVEAAHIDAPALAPRQDATGARWPNPCCCGTSGSCIGAGGAATAHPARGSAWRLNLSADDNVRSKNSLSGGIIAPRRLR
jgi:hypothetical protein